ncbi:hypothetical protein MBAV_006308 [Candidatus Magnetobacterium bavaricum]|uniref:Uncharacterized protein n=1 Tax=Candidatus Magnetobacterium bavaricum TaxID=29290 RepID=A0A0F3GHT5_9BACT|nr:hypothetical protein MBAV_006308 [Candidatus Magnetobacterium bavaricum]
MMTKDIVSIGTLNSEKIGAFFGLASLDLGRDKLSALDAARLGKASVKSVLYIGALSAINCNQEIRARRLIAKIKTIYCCSMHRLLINRVLNADY